MGKALGREEQFAVIVDNQAVVEAINSRSCRESHIMHMASFDPPSNYGEVGNTVTFPS